MALCPNWELVDFYIDEGATAPNMESAKEWCRLLSDCFAGKVDLIITQKVSNVSKKHYEITILSRLLAALEKPPLTPPGWVFPVVWTVLYAMMGTASYKVYASDAHDIRRRRALTVYGVQLAVNFLWTVVFFALGAHLSAFWLIVLLWLLIVVCMLMFYHISQKAGRLMIPYALWVSFAAYLNLGVYLLNR